jgi:predicted NBD/HSP70 family sugar kinase
MRLRAEQRTFVGVNLHGTDVSVIVVDALCRELSGCYTESLSSTDPAAVVRRIAILIERSAAGITPSPVLVGVSLGGHPDNDHDITYAPFLHWDSTVHLAAMLQAACDIPVVVANDLDALLLFESWFGAGVGISRFALLTIGVGVGYALSERGEPVDYPDKSYGLIGHALVDNHGPRCFAGHTGCAQCLTSASLAEEYSTAMGRAMSFEDFARDVREGKAQAQSLVDTTCFRLGTLIATVENFAMPQKVFINGETSFLARFNTESIRSAISSLRPSRASRVDFTILDFSWGYWAKAAAANAIARYLL